MYNVLSMLKTFMNTSDEQHAYVIGFSETFAIRRPFFFMGAYNCKCLLEEYHYYMFGRAVGVFAWVGIATGLIKIWR